MAPPSARRSSGRCWAAVDGGDVAALDIMNPIVAGFAVKYPCPFCVFPVKRLWSVSGSRPASVNRGWALAAQDWGHLLAL